MGNNLETMFTLKIGNEQELLINHFIICMWTQ
jgi:hypothetical protein